MNGELPRSRRWMLAVLVLLAVVIGGMAVKRTLSGNADLSGNYRHWRANLHQARLPVRREGPVPEDPDPYPPITYAVFAPFGALPLWATATLWYGLNVGCSIYLWRTGQQWLQTELSSTPERSIGMLGRWIPVTPESILGMALLAIFPAWISTLLLGQNTLVVMTLTWAAYQAARRDHPWSAGVMLGAATVVKVLPVVFVLPFVMRRNYRLLLAYALTGMMIVAGLGTLYFGPRTNYEFHRTWLFFAASGPENRSADPHDPNTLRGSLRFHNQSLEVVLARLIMDVPIHNREGAPHVNFWSVSAENWRLVRSIASGLCLLIGLIALWRTISRILPADDVSTAPPETSVEAYAIVSLLQLFISPVVWSHYYVWLFWPLLMLLVSAIRGDRTAAVIYLAWLACLPALAIPHLRAIGVHMWVSLAIYGWTCWPWRVKSGTIRPSDQLLQKLPSPEAASPSPA